MLLDILPLVYLIIHPEIREINIQLFNPWEKEIFVRAIELMVLFDIKLIQPKSQAQNSDFLRTVPSAQ